MGEDNIFKMFPGLPKMVVDFIKKLVATIGEKDSKIARQEEEIRELRERLGLNSRNSSKPPHTDGYGKQAGHAEKGEADADATRQEPAVSKNRSLREKSGRKAGGQKGHKGAGMKFSGPPDETLEHVPDPCVGCPDRSGCDGSRELVATQNEKVLEIRLRRVCHKTYAYCCPLRDGERLEGGKPFGGTNRYGSSVVSFITLLYALGVVSYDRIGKIFKGLTGESISTGTLHTFIMGCRDKVAGAVGRIKELLAGSVLAHFDETGLFVNGVLNWLHTASNSVFTYLSVQKKRGEEGMRAAGVLGLFKGIAVTDCWSPYFKFKGIGHALCNAHLIRELRNRLTNAKQEWAGKMDKLLNLINDEKHALIDRGILAFPDERLVEFVKQYDGIVSVGIRGNPIPERKPNQRGRLKLGKTRALLERLVKYKDYYLLFAYDFTVPFTNNEAERSCRAARVRENVSCFRTDNGASTWADIMSYIKTAVKNGVTEYDAIKAMLSGDALNLIENITVDKR